MDNWTFCETGGTTLSVHQEALLRSSETIMFLSLIVRMLFHVIVGVFFLCYIYFDKTSSALLLLRVYSFSGSLVEDAWLNAHAQQ